MLAFRSIAIGLLAFASLACGDRKSKEDATGTVTGDPATNTSTASDDDAPMAATNDAGSNGTGNPTTASPDSTGEGSTCQELSNAAADAYYTQTKDVPFCEVDSDCTRAFPFTVPRCWYECAYGSSSFGSTTREAAEVAAMASDNVVEPCSEFESRGCMLVPQSCPPNFESAPVTFKCEDRVCVVVEPESEPESELECPPDLSEIATPECTDTTEPIDEKTSVADRDQWQSAPPDAAHEVLIVVRKAFTICPAPPCAGTDRQCPELDAYLEWLDRSYLASQVCVRNLIAERGGSAEPEALIGNVIVAYLTWQQIQVVAASPDVISVSGSATDTPPP